MAVSLQYPNSKKTKVAYTNYPRECYDTVHYPNHSLGIKKHNCTVKNGSYRNKTQFGCSPFRPVTRRNITDMPTSQIGDGSCDHLSKCSDTVSGKSCSILKPYPSVSTPRTAIACIGQEFLDTEYDAPCVVNGIRQSKPTCHTDRKFERQKVAFQEHVTRMQNSKQRPLVNCCCKHTVTYCDGYTDPMAEPYIVMHTQHQFENKCICELAIDRPSSSYKSATATRSFGTSTSSEAPPRIRPSYSIATNTTNIVLPVASRCEDSSTIFKPIPAIGINSLNNPYTELSYSTATNTTNRVLPVASRYEGPSTIFKTTPANETSSLNKPDHKLDSRRDGCIRVTCPTMIFANKSEDKNNTLQQEIPMRYETHSTNTSDTPQQEIPIRYETHSTNTSDTPQQEIPIRYETHSTNTESIKEQLVINVAPSKAKEDIQCSEKCPFVYPLLCTKEVNSKMLRDGDKWCKDVPVCNAHLCMQFDEISQKYNASKHLKHLENEISVEITSMPDDKGRSTFEDVTYEPYDNILNYIVNNDQNKSIQTNHKQKSTYSTHSNNSHKRAKKRKKSKKSKGNGGKTEDVEAISNESPFQATEASIDSVITESPQNEGSPTELSFYDESSTEIVQNPKAKKMKQRGEKVVNERPDVEKLQKLAIMQPILSVILHDVIDQCIIDHESNLETSDNTQSNDIQEQKELDDAEQSQIYYMDKTAIKADVSVGMRRGSLKGHHSSEINKMLQSFYEKIREKHSAISQDDTSTTNPSEIEEYIEDMTVSILKKIKDYFGNESQENIETIKTAKKLEVISAGLSTATKARIHAKQTAGSKPLRKVCAKRKGLRHTFKDPDERVCESLLQLSTEKLGYVEHHEYLQFSLRITEDIIRNDLYTNGQMKRVFKSHLEANRGRLDTQKMIDQINSLCLELNIPFDEVLPFENMTPAIACDQTVDKNVVCCCKEENGALEANRHCMCNVEYYKGLQGFPNSKGDKEKKDLDCECCQHYCTGSRCPGIGYKEPLTEEEFQQIVDNVRIGTGQDFDFANEGVLQSIMYSETQCIGPRNKEGECICAAISEMIRPTSPAVTGYIPSFASSNNGTRKPVSKLGSVKSDNNDRKNIVNAKQNKGKLIPGLRIRGMHRKDGVFTSSNDNVDVPEDSAPVGIKTPVTALRTQLGNAKPENNFVIVQCPVVVPIEVPRIINNKTVNSEVDSAIGTEKQLKVQYLPIDVNAKTENSTEARTNEIVGQLKEDIKLVGYANEINETLTDPLLVPACNNCSCDADCNKKNDNLTINDTSEKENNDKNTGGYSQFKENESNKELTLLMQNNNENTFNDNRINDTVAMIKDQNAANSLRTYNDLPKAFATSGLKSRLEELTAVTLAISNNNMQSLLEKHPVYKPKNNCTTCHFNENFIRPVESASVFYPSKGLNSVYSKCLFQQNNLLLGDEYVMFNPYSVRPETILHFFPSTCTQVNSDDLMKASKSSLSSDNSGVTTIVDNMINMQRDSAKNNSARKLVNVPPENLVKAIKSEINKVTESKQIVESDISTKSPEKNKSSSRRSSSISDKSKQPSEKSNEYSTKLSQGTKESSGASSHWKRNSLLSAVEEEDHITPIASVTEEEVDIDVQSSEEEDEAEITEISISKNSSYNSIQGQVQLQQDLESVTYPDVDSKEEVNIITMDSDLDTAKSKTKSRSSTKVHDSDSEESSGSTSGGVEVNDWMKKLDNVPSIKMTPSLKGSFDKALSDTDKFRENHNKPDEAPLIAGMAKHIRSGQTVKNESNISQNKKSSVTSYTSKQASSNNSKQVSSNSSKQA